ncbi:hypothetical protein M569_05397 [Genlisea aurea]|uniref:Chalcone-flavonone isomerase family protein n=1 Tax=Genlisea aurea TaxID=192259 RepID=S8CQF2_9LAMI|nr:hypothetical protein M569_05397 [Genlisea aurea]
MAPLMTLYGFMSLGLEMCEMALWYSEYANFNSTGKRPARITLWAVSFTAAKKAVSRILLLIVSMGHGVVRESVSMSVRVAVVGGAVCGVAGCGSGLLLFHTLDPLSWLSKTLEKLQMKRSMGKLELYRKLTNGVAVSAVASSKMGTEVVLVDDVPFPAQLSATKPLILLAHGITDLEIHYLQIKFTAIGVYLDPEISTHLQRWKGRAAGDLAQDDEFFSDVVSAGVEKVVKVVVIKEIKGSQFGVQLESTVRDRLAQEDNYNDDEEACVEAILQFFQSKYLNKGSTIAFHFPPAPSPARIVFGKQDDATTLLVENANVAEAIQKWYLGGSRGVSPTTTSSLAHHLAGLLSK